MRGDMHVVHASGSCHVNLIVDGDGTNLPKLLQFCFLCTPSDNINNVDAQLLCKGCDHASKVRPCCGLDQVFTLWDIAGIQQTHCSHRVHLQLTDGLRMDQLPT